MGLQLKNIMFYVLSCKPKYLDKKQKRLASHYFWKKLCKLENSVKVQAFTVTF